MSTEWETPQDFFDTLNAEFHFTLDVCASHQNAKCKRFCTKENSGLIAKWEEEIVWLNPPYNRTIGIWIEKAYHESQRGATVVCLIQGRSTDTKMWHDYVMKASEIRFIKNRLHFTNNGKSARANISSVIVIFRPYYKGYPAIYSIDTLGQRLTR
jgi:site-specific DNA-methyltransferase (adenine-specific)